MAKFLNTTAINYHLEELISRAGEKLVLISPYLKFSNRMKELLEDKNRLKIDVRVVYGKSELAPREINWLRTLEFIRTSFCANLHAKCYLSEHEAIITSMNLYDFSQINNNEMGVLVQRSGDPDLYRDTSDEAQRLIRVSDQVRMSAEEVAEPSEAANVQPPSDKPLPPAAKEPEKATTLPDKVSTSKIARSMKMKTAELNELLLSKGMIVKVDDQFQLTDLGVEAGGEFRKSSRFGPYFIWPKDMTL